MHVLTLYGSTVVSRLTLSYTCSVLHDDDDAFCFEASSEATSMTHEPPSQEHSMHFAARYGRSPVCVRLCLVRLLDCEKRLPQPSCSQAYGWSPV